MTEHRARYVALYERPGDVGGNYLRTVILTYPEGMIPPPTVSMSVPFGGIHEFTYAQTQADAARLYGTTQQTIGRWMRNKAPDLLAERERSSSDAADD